jgi:hypothetical protein
MHTTSNGPEEAHDYLWAAQDLWMAPDVWDWVNEDAAVADLVLKYCSRPDCAAQETKATQFKRCAACQQVRPASFPFLCAFSFPDHFGM